MQKSILQKLNLQKNIAPIITKVRKDVPLVQAITNYVTINDCANILLAFGASPAMVEAEDEAFGFAKISGAVYLNIGTLTKEQENAALEASLAARLHRVPLVLDPVGCAAIPRKTQVIKRILETGRVDIIKGNAGEIKFLAGVQGKARGVDSTDDGQGLFEACIGLAKEYNCVVAASGREDVVTDGTASALITNGVEMLTKITGSGCMLGALCAATAAVAADPLEATVAAVAAMGIAGEMAYRESQLPGTFKTKLMDAVYLLNEDILQKEGKITWL